jgi:hypothetical protein
MAVVGSAVVLSSTMIGALASLRAKKERSTIFEPMMPLTIAVTAI